MSEEIITRVEDEIDEAVQRIASEACSGTLDEDAARMRIMELIVGAQITQFVADRAPAEAWERDEVADRIHENLIDRVLDHDGLDLEIASHSSVVGWARQEAFRKATWSLGEIRRERRRTRSVGDFESEGLDIAEPTPESPSDEFMDLAEGFATKAKGTRERSRSLIAARTLLDAYRLPNPVSPECREDRDWIESAISSDHGVAHRALVAFVRLIDGRQSPSDHHVDDRLMALWDDYSYEQAELLEGKSPMVIRTIVAAAVARRPRPNKKTISEITDIILLAGEGDGWVEFAQDVTETWLARECEPFSEFVALGAEERRKTRQIAAERASRWDSLVEASQKYGNPFGKSSEDAVSWVAAVFDSVISYPTTL